MAKYFSGITVYENKYKISIIDDNLNIIFLDNLDYDRLMELLKRKSVMIMSVDAPLISYSRSILQADNAGNKIIRIKRRHFDNNLIQKNLLTYNDRFNVSSDRMEILLKLYNGLNNLGFSIRKPGETEKAIIESYPDTSFSVLGYTEGQGCSVDEALRKKAEFLKYKGIRIKDYFKKSSRDMVVEINTLCQAYTAFLYFNGECTCLGSEAEGILVIPAKNVFSTPKLSSDPQKSIRSSNMPIQKTESKPNNITNKPAAVLAGNRLKGASVIAEYCGAQYLYTNTDGVIRINELRPIKSYRPFTEIYEIKHIRQVQVIINTTDGLRKVKANLIPNQENSNSFKAADDEDKKKLDSFWGNHGDKRGYLIKFNKVEIIKA